MSQLHKMINNLDTPIDEIRACLNTPDININELDERGRAALHCAALLGRIDVIELLVAKGIDINILDSEGRTALHLAAEQGHFETILCLLTQHASPLIADNEGKLFIYEAVKQATNISQLTSILARVNEERHAELLQAKTHNGQTLLHAAAAKNDDPMMYEFLINQKINPNVKDAFKYLPIHYLAKRGAILPAQFLFSQGTDLISLNINGDNPLHQAQKYGHWQFANEFHRYIIEFDFYQADLEPDILEKTQQAFEIINSYYDIEKRNEYIERNSTQSTQDGTFFDKALLTEIANQSQTILSDIIRQTEYQFPAITAHALLLLSDLYLMQKNYKNAMLFAAGAKAYYEKHVDKKVLTSEKRLSLQLERLLINYRQNECKQLDRMFPIKFDGYRLMLNNHRATIRAMLNDVTSMPEILEQNTAAFTALARDLTEMAIELAGQTVPCKYFALIGLGSMGRGEMSLYSDFEFAILVNRSTPEIKDYFKGIAKIMELLVIGLGETPLPVLKNGYSPTPTGFHFDDGGNTALYDQFVSTPSELAALQEQTDDGTLIARNALRTVRHIMGENRLVESYEQELAEIYSKKINTGSGKVSSFIKKIRGKDRTLCQQEAVKIMMGDVEEFDPNQMAEQKHRKKIFNYNVKSELYRLPSQTIANLALYFGIQAKKTWERLELLRIQKIISEDAFNKLSSLMTYVISLRLKAHAHYESEEESLHHASMVEPLKDSREHRPYMLDSEMIGRIAELYQILIPLHETVKSFIELHHSGSKLSGKNNPFSQAELHDTRPITLAFAFERLCKPEDAQQCYLQALQLNPTNIELHIKQARFIDQQLTEKQGVIVENDLLAEQWIRNIILLLSSSDTTAEHYIKYYRALNESNRILFKRAIKSISETQRNVMGIVEFLESETSVSPHRVRQRIVDEISSDSKFTTFLSIYESLESKTKIETSALSNLLNQHHSLLQELSLVDPEIYFLGLIILERLQESYNRQLEEQQDILSRSLNSLIKVLTTQGGEFDQFKNVYVQLPINIRQTFRQQLLLIADRESDSQSIHLILRELNTFPDESGNRAVWDQSKERWRTLFNTLVSGPSTKSSQKVQMVSPLLGDGVALTPYDLNPDIQHVLFTGQNRFREQTINGSTHQVIPLVTEAGQVYVKAGPEMPGMTWLMEQIHNRLIGHGTCFGELVRLDIPGRKEPLAVLMSQGVPGPTLHMVLKNSPEWMERLEHRHYSELVLLAILTNPEDGIPTNFIVQTLPDGQIVLVSVDHDHALFPAYLQKDGKLELQIKTILFCLDNMLKQIDPNAAKAFLALNPAKVLRAILRDAQQQNRHYQQLFDEQTIQQFYKNRKGGNTAIPIPIKSGDIAKLYHKMVRLQNLIRQYPEITLLQCLLNIEPRVGLVYQRALKDEKNPLTRLQKVGSYPTNAKGELVTHTSALRTLRLQSTLMQANDYFDLKDLRPEEGLAELDRLAYQEEQLDRIREQVRQGDFTQFTLLLAHEHKELVLNGQPEKKLTGIDISQLTPEQQLRLLEVLATTPMHELHLANCSVLSPEMFNRLIMVSKDLLNLDLSAQDLIDFHLEYIAEHCRTLRQLVLRNLQNLTRLTSPFHELEQLTLDGSAIQEINITAEKLEILRLKNCINLQKIRTASESLYYLDIRGCRELSVEGLFGSANTHYRFLTNRSQTLLFEGATHIEQQILLTLFPFLIYIDLKQQSEGFLLHLQRMLQEMLEKYQIDLNNLSPELRQRCTRYWAMYQQIQELLSFQLTDKSELVRKEAAKTIAKLDLINAQLLEKIIIALTDEDKNIVNELVRSLTQLCRSNTVVLSAMIAALNHPDPVVRLGSVKCFIELSDLFTAEIVDALVANLKVVSGGVRQYSAVALGKMSVTTPSVINGLISVFEDLLEEVRAIARTALVKLLRRAENLSHMQLLVDAANSERRIVSEQAILALGEVGASNESIITNLIRLYESNDRPQQRMNILKALFLMKANSPIVLEFVQQVLIDQSTKLRLHAAKILHGLNIVTDDSIAVLQDGLKNRELGSTLQMDAIEGFILALPERPALFDFLGGIIDSNSGNQINEFIVGILSEKIHEISSSYLLLIRAMQDPNLATREKVLNALSKLTDEKVELYEALYAALSGQEAEQVKLVLSAFTDLYKRNIYRTQLNQAFENTTEDLAIKLAIIILAADPINTAARNCLIRSISSPNNYLQNLSISILGQYAIPDVTLINAMIVTFINFSDNEEKKMLLESSLLSLLSKNPEFISQLFEYASDDSNFQILMAHMLGNLTNKLDQNEIVPLLQRMFLVQAEDKKIHVLKALLQYGILSDEILDHLISAANYSLQPIVRATAASAIQELGSFTVLLTKLLESSLAQERKAITSPALLLSSVGHFAEQKLTPIAAVESTITLGLG